jgi:hypothetical protein
VTEEIYEVEGNHVVMYLQTICESRSGELEKLTESRMANGACLLDGQGSVKSGA